MKKILASVLFLFFVSLGAAFAQTPTKTPTTTASPAPSRPSATPPPPSSDDDVVKISTRLIQVDATVTDKDGKIVTDLKPEDFEIFENKQKQEITNFSFVSTVRGAAAAATPAPKNTAKNSLPPPPPVALRPEQVRRTIALVVDDLTLSFESVYYVRRALKKFVDEQMQDGDLVAIIRSGAGMGALQQFTSDRRQLYAAIEKIRWNPSGNGKISAFAPLEATPLEQRQSMGDETVTEERLEAEKNSLRSQSDFRSDVFATGTLGALDYVVRGMRELPGRKSVMLFSDGFKLFVKDQSGFTEQARILESLRRLTDLANRASVVIYTMDARGLQTLGLTAADDVGDLSSEQIETRLSDRKTELFDTQQGLTYLAQQTGGFALINNNDLSGGVRQVLNDQNGYYLIGYVPDEETFDEKTRRFNKLSIRVKRPGLKVRYRSGFFGTSDEEKVQSDTSAATAATTRQTPGQQLAAAISSPFSVNGVDLRLNALFVNDARNGAFVRSFLHVDAADLKFTDEPDGTHKTTFDILALSFGENGQVVDQISKNYTVTLKGESYQNILKEGFVYSFALPVKKPGAYQLRIALRDSASAKVGSANQFIEIPNLKKGDLTLSGMVLENITLKQYQNLQTNVASPAAAAAAGAGGDTDSADLRNSPQADTSLRRFKRGTVLRYGYEIYNAKVDAATQKPQLTQQIRIFRDGKLEFDGKPLPITTAQQTDWRRIPWGGALSLGGELLPGDYVLQIIVTDTLAKEKRRLTAQFVQFEVVE